MPHETNRAAIVSQDDVMVTRETALKIGSEDTVIGLRRHRQRSTVPVSKDKHWLQEYYEVLRGALDLEGSCGPGNELPCYKNGSKLFTIRDTNSCRRRIHLNNLTI